MRPSATSLSAMYARGVRMSAAAAGRVIVRQPDDLQRRHGAGAYESFELLHPAIVSQLIADLHAESGIGRVDVSDQSALHAM